MIDNFQRRLGVLLATAAVALGAWKWLPGTSLDRKAFEVVASGSANGPLFISGDGSRAKPWTLRTFSPDPRADKREAPVIVSLGDDPDRFFQSSPPAPIDLAVVLTNFQRLGAKRAASAAVMAWEKPDPIGLVALEKALDGFESLVMAAPLSRGVVPSPMPPSFRRTSIPVSDIQGDASALPLVNRVPIPGIILGGDETITGFSVLEAEPRTERVPLMAKWEDRVVFSFSLLTVLQRLDLPLAGVEVRLGEFLKLGPAGPIVPVDAFGRFEMPSRSVSPYAEISAEALIDGGDDLFPKLAPDPVILRDDRSALDPATRAFARDFPGVIASIASNGGLSDARAFAGLAEKWEVGILAVVVLALFFLSGSTLFVRLVGAIVVIGVGMAAQWITFGAASSWFPGLAVGFTVIAGLIFTRLLSVKSAGVSSEVLTPGVAVAEVVAAPEIRTPEPVEQMESPSEIVVTEPVAPAEVEPVAEPEAQPPAKKRAARKTAAKEKAPRKTAAKKTAAKKTPARKTPARKTAKPKSPPKDEPPAES